MYVRTNLNVFFRIEQQLKKDWHVVFCKKKYSSETTKPNPMTIHRLIFTLTQLQLGDYIGQQQHFSSDVSTGGCRMFRRPQHEDRLHRWSHHICSDVWVTPGKLRNRESI